MLEMEVFDYIVKEGFRPLSEGFSPDATLVYRRDTVIANRISWHNFNSHNKLFIFHVPFHFIIHIVFIHLIMFLLTLLSLIRYFSYTYNFEIEYLI